MASAITLKAVGDWNRQMAVPLNNALQATIEMTGRSGRQACEMAMVYMARSARAMTPQAKKNRRVLKGPRGGKYVEKYYKDGTKKDLYQSSFPYRGYTWENAKQIKSRGLAKRSWFWGLKGLSKAPGVDGKDIPGVANLTEYLSSDKCGLILFDRLNYMLKIMPSGFEQAVANKASNQIMSQNAKKIERKFSVEIPRLAASRALKAQKKLEREFRKTA